MSDAAVKIARAIGLVLLVNLLPAFGPPTWTLLVYFRIHQGLSPVLLVVGGATAATTGRLGLALAVRRFGRRLPPKRREHLEALGTVISSRPGGLLGAMAFFMVSPLPSNAIFEAAGLAGARLLPLAGAFLAGRLVSYSLYVTGASIARARLERLLEGGVSSPAAIGVQVLGLLVVVLIVLVRWIDVIDFTSAWYARMRHRPAPPSIRSRLK